MWASTLCPCSCGSLRGIKTEAVTPLPGLSIYPQEPLSTVCSQLPTAGLSCALRFIHRFIHQKSTGSFFTPGTDRAWAVSTHLFPDWHLHWHYITLAARRVVWIEVCVGLGDGSVCVCVRLVGASECLYGCQQILYEKLSVCIYACMCIDVVCTVCVHQVYVSDSPCCVTGHPRPSGLKQQIISLWFYELAIWSGISWAVLVLPRLTDVAAVSWGLVILEGLTHMSGSWQAVCWGASVHLQEASTGSFTWWSGGFVFSSNARVLFKASSWAMITNVPLAKVTWSSQIQGVNK